MDDNRKDILWVSARQRTCRDLCNRMLGWGFGVGDLAYCVLGILDRLDILESQTKENPQPVRAVGESGTEYASDGVSLKPTSHYAFSWED